MTFLSFMITSSARVSLLFRNFVKYKSIQDMHSLEGVFQGVVRWIFTFSDILLIHAI